MPELELYGIDPWAVYPHDNQQPKPDHAQPIGETQTLYWGLPIALRQLAVNASRWHPIRLSSVKAARCFDDGELDFVFIDAEHSYEAAKTDIATWWPKLRPGGLLIGHDYHRKRFPGVCRAVDEFAERERLPLIMKAHSVWALQIPKH